ncbi:MAG: hypothetical protein STSR0009_24180 [Methanoregula sp.]
MGDSPAPYPLILFPQLPGGGCLRTCPDTRWLPFAARTGDQWHPYVHFRGADVRVYQPVL